MTWADHEAWWIYMVRCRNNALYCGITRTVLHRVHQHNLGLGARYTRSFRPVTLVWCKKIGPLRDAMSAERRVKKLSKEGKERLVREHPAMDKEC